MSTDLTDEWPSDKSGSLSKRLVAGLAALILLICSVAFWVIWIQGRPLLESLSYQQQTRLGQNITLALGQRIGAIEGITMSMAKTALSLPKTESLYFDVFPTVMDQLGNDSIIAGGGIWPEPYMFDSQVERHSFFWGRDDNGEFKFFGDYNDVDGSGYHQEEWYVPARMLTEDDVYWSKSYTDPYSLQPMVTCTAPLWREGQFQGVATIDLMLNEVSNIIDQLVGEGGYAFVVDRNNKFIAFPKTELVLTHRKDSGQDTPDFIYVSELANKEPAFLDMAEGLDRIEYQLFLSSQEADRNMSNMIRDLELASYQIDKNEARRIAAHLWAIEHSTSDYPIEIARFDLDIDFLLGEAASVIVFQMPKTNWKVITVFKQSKHRQVTDAISLRLLLFLSAAIILFGVVAYSLLRSTIIKRIQDMSKELRRVVETGGQGAMKLDYQYTDEVGELVYWFNRHSAITEEARQHAERASRVKSDFLAKMSHEFRTPLNSIIGFSRRLLKQTKNQLDQRSCDALQSIYRSALHQLDLINDILDHAAIESGSVRFRVAKESVNDLLAYVEAQNRELVLSRGLDFSVSKLVKDIEVECDKQKLQQVFSNLVSNSVKASESGVISISVKETVYRDRPAIEFAVSDNGVGIPLNDQDMLFKPFTQLDNRICVPGTGLGLFLARYYADLHGGTIRLDSNPDVAPGATFYIIVPIVAQTPLSQRSVGTTE